MNIATKRHLSRRAFLRGTGTVLSLPFLEAMTPAFTRATTQPPKRFVAMCATLGFHTPFLHPKETGTGYTITPYLEPLAEFKHEHCLAPGRIPRILPAHFFGVARRVSGGRHWS